MVAWRKVQRVMAIALPDGTQILPLPFGQPILSALDRVTDVDDEIGVHQVDFAPDASENLRLRATGAVADDGEAEIVLRLGQRAQTDHAGEQQHNGAAHQPSFIAGMHKAIVS